MSRPVLVKAGNVGNHLCQNQIQSPFWFVCIFSNSHVMLYSIIAHKLTTVQPSFSRRVSFRLGHHMQMFSLNKVRTFAAVNRAKENKTQKTCLATEQQIALRWPTIVYTHLFCRELWGGCPGNPAHRGCSSQYHIVKRVSVHVCTYHISPPHVLH